MKVSNIIRPLVLSIGLFSLIALNGQQQVSLKNGLNSTSALSFGLGLGCLWKARLQEQEEAAHYKRMQEQFNQYHEEVKNRFAEIRTLVMSSPRKEIPQELCDQALAAYTRLAETRDHLRFSPADLRYHLRTYNALYANENQSKDTVTALETVTNEVANDTLAAVRVRAFEGTTASSCYKNFFRFTGLSCLCFIAGHFATP